MSNFVHLRAMNPRDINWVTNSWLENARKMWLVKGVPNEVYYRQHHKLLEVLIPRALVIVACNPDRPDDNYGWMCCECIDNVLIIHYMYVKDRWKCKKGNNDTHKAGHGIGTLMLEKVLEYEDNIRAVVYTHETEAGRKFLEAMYDRGVLPVRALYNPYLLFTSMPADWNHTRVQLAKEPE